MAVEKNSAIIFEVRARHGFASGMFGIKRRGPQHDVLAIEGAIALADRHRRLPGVKPYGCEAVRLRIETGDSGACALRTIGIEEREIGLEKFSVLNHVLLAGCLRHDRFAIGGKERFNHIPIARKLREQLLTGSGRARRLVLIVGLLRDQRSGKGRIGSRWGLRDRRSSEEQNCRNPFRHGRR